MDIEELKYQINGVIDQWWAKNHPNSRVGSPALGLVGGAVLDEHTANQAATAGSDPVQPPRNLPEGKRVVRTKTSGDRVYMIDEVKKTRQWVTNPDVLQGYGFELGDVVEVDDNELLKYQMGPALYKAPDGNAQSA